MEALADFEDRLAARLLGVPMDADAGAIRGRFRALVKAVHPDRTVLDGCIDLGQLADARDRLLARVERRVGEVVEVREAKARRVAADRRLDAMRPRMAAPQPAPDLEADAVQRFDSRAIERAKVRHPSAVSWEPQPSAHTARFETDHRIGAVVDLAG